MKLLFTVEVTIACEGDIARDLLHLEIIRFANSIILADRAYTEIKVDMWGDPFPPSEAVTAA